MFQAGAGQCQFIHHGGIFERKRARKNPIAGDAMRVRGHARRRQRKHKHARAEGREGLKPSQPIAKACEKDPATRDAPHWMMRKHEVPKLID